MNSSSTLQSLLKKIHRKDKNAKFVFVGDYVDRGKHSSKVIDFLIDLKNEGAVCLRGNHDDVVNWLLAGHSQSHLSELIVGTVTVEKVYAWWTKHGFDLVLESYGVDPKNKTVMEIVDEFRRMVPEIHLEFLNSLPIFWENNTHFSCHAFFDPFVELPRDMKFVKTEKYDGCLWGRFNDGHIYLPHKWDKIGVFGHTPIPYPYKLGKIRLIDTACFKGGNLTAYCCETDDFIDVSADDRDLDPRWKGL